MQETKCSKQWEGADTVNICEFPDIRTPGKKILIADSVKNANRLVRKSGKILFNVEVKTLKDIAVEAVSASYAKNSMKERVRVLGDRACANILYDILKENMPKFLPEVCLDINTALGLLRIINMIRLGIPTQDYENETDEEKKIVQLKKIVGLYEKYLKDNKLYDRARLLDIDKELFDLSNVSYYALKSENRSKKKKNL